MSIEEVGTYATYKNDSIFKLSMNKISVRTRTYKFNIFILRLPNGTFQQDFKSESVKLIDCSEEAITVDNVRDYFKGFNLPTLFCIDFQNIDQFLLQGSYDTEEWDYLKIELDQCKNDTLKGTNN